MTNWGERGTAEVIGAVIMLGLFIILLSLMQVYAIPSQSREVEFDAYQDATADLTELRNDLLRAASTGNTFGTTVKTGATYPPRMILINPPTATGTLRTVDSSNVTFSDVVATGSGNVRTFWNGDPHEYSTRTVRFDPAYSELDLSPIVLEHGLAYRDADNPVALSDSPFVRGNKISLVTLTGSLQEAGISVPATVRPVSPQTRTITVTGQGANPFSVTVPSDLPATYWENTILAGEMDPAGSPDLPDKYVQSVTPGPTAGTVTITFEGDKKYELEIGQVALTTSESGADFGSPSARYLVSQTERSLSTDKTGRVKLITEARDRFNNPVSDQPVTFTTNNGRFEDADGTVLNPSNPSQVTVASDDEGQADVYYNATGYLGSNTVTAYMDATANTGLPSEQEVTYSVFNSVIGGGGGGGDGEQAGRILVVLTSHDGFANKDDNDIVFNIDNTGSNSVNITGYRLDYVTSIQSNGQLTQGPSYIDSFQLDANPAKTGDAYEAQTPYFFSNDPYSLSPGAHSLTITFDQPIGWDGSGTENVRGAFLQLAVYIEGDITVTFSIHVII